MQKSGSIDLDKFLQWENAANEQFCGFIALKVVWEKKAIHKGPNCGVAAGIPHLTIQPRRFKRALSSEKDMDSLNAEYFKKPNSEILDNIG